MTRHIVFAELASSPWANGLGETVEIARRPQAGRLDWRLSIATVDSAAPFSPLADVDRALMALSDGGLILQVGGRRTALARHQTLHFVGEDEVNAVEVTAPTLDLNLMVRRGLGSPDLVATAVVGSLVITDALAVVALAGSLSYDGHRLARYDTVLVGPEPVTLTGDGTVAVALLSARE